MGVYLPLELKEEVEKEDNGYDEYKPQNFEKPCRSRRGFFLIL